MQNSVMVTPAKRVLAVIAKFCIVVSLANVALDKILIYAIWIGASATASWGCSLEVVIIILVCQTRCTRRGIVCALGYAIIAGVQVSSPRLKITRYSEGVFTPKRKRYRNMAA